MQKKNYRQAEAKLLKTLDINDTLNYLKYQFWLYGTNIYKYNFTFPEFRVSRGDVLRGNFCSVILRTHQ
jgi:hypothetical protein